MPIRCVIARHEAIQHPRLFEIASTVKSRNSEVLKLFLQKNLNTSPNQWFGTFLSILAKAWSSLTFSSHDLKVVAIINPLIKGALAQLGKNYRTID